MNERRSFLPLWIALSRAALIWEWFWPTISPLLLVIIGFLALAGTGLVSVLPVWAHVGLLLGFLALIGWSGLGIVRGLPLPDAGAGARRLERDNGLTHRPLAALGDRPSGNLDPLAAALWQVHQARMTEALGRVAPKPPRRGLLSQDAYGLRAALSLLLVVSAVSAGPAFWPRVGAAFLPDSRFIPAYEPVRFDLWLTPPDYTGLAPLYVTSADLIDDKGQARPEVPTVFSVPEGTSLLAQIHGGRTVPTVVRDGTAVEFAPLGVGDYSFSGPLGTPKRLSLSQGGIVLGRWDLALIADEPPVARFVAPPKPGQNGVLAFDVEASHQWGIKGLALEVTRTEPASVDASEKPLMLDLALGGSSRAQVHHKIIQDLTAHPWAGAAVEIRVVATSVSGKIGRSEPVALTLPERGFRHPVAHAIVDQRKILLREPQEADGVAEILGDLAVRPRLYQDNYTAYLTLNLAIASLQAKPTATEIAQVVDWTWRTALLIEDGTVPDALKDLRKAQQALQDALNRNASDAEIDQLMRNLREAMNRYTQGLIDKANREPADDQGDQPGRKTVTQDDLKRMLDRAERMAKSGSKEAARDALAQLQQMLEGMKGTRKADGKDGKGGKGKDALRGLQDLTRKQQDLMDRSYKQAQRDQNGGEAAGKEGKGRGKERGGKPGPGASGGTDPETLSREQNALRQELGRLRQKLGRQDGGAGDALDRAEQAMKDAGDALKQGKAGDALGAEAEAMDDLQQAAKAMAENNPDGDGKEQAGRDPFGRDPGGPTDRIGDGDVKVPTESDMQRSRGILEELRRRSGERERPPVDRDYIDRLLRRF